MNRKNEESQPKMSKLFIVDGCLENGKNTLKVVENILQGKPLVNTNNVSIQLHCSKKIPKPKNCKALKEWNKILAS